MKNYPLDKIKRVFQSTYSDALFNWEEFEEALNEPDWKPYIGQIILSEGTYQTYHKGYLDNHIIRPLTTKEAGPECMQHLLDALETIADVPSASYEWYSGVAQRAVTEHEEKMK